MKKHIPAQDRYFRDFGWLKAHWLFSFGNYYDPENLGFGTLRVFNHDTVEPKSGFPTHPHENMEIVTIVLEGELAHEDNTGGKGVILPGRVQRMTAGNGVTHSEYNHADEPLRLLQIWFLPDREGREPGYSEYDFDPSDWKGSPLALAAPDGSAPIDLHADAKLFRCELDEDGETEFTAGEGRGVFVYLLSGGLEVNGVSLAPCDQLRITDETEFEFKSAEGADFVLIEVPV
jgi:redox-sensitive bicupin YhaK (pirin superfamily)